MNNKIFKNTVTTVVRNILSTLLFYFAFVIVGYFVYKLVTGNYKNAGEVVYLVLSAYFGIGYILKNFPKRKELRFIWNWFCMWLEFLFCEHCYRIGADLNYRICSPMHYNGEEIIHCGERGHEITLVCSKCGKRKDIPTFFTDRF